MKVVQPITITPAMVVQSTVFDTAPTIYSPSTTYAQGNYASVVGVLGEVRIYKSLQSDNTDNTPTSSPLWWVYSSSTYVTYVRGTDDFDEEGYRVLDADTNKIYESISPKSSNQPLDPIANPVWQVTKVSTPPVAPSWSPSTTYAINTVVYVERFSTDLIPVVIERGAYVSITSGNIGNQPTSSPTHWQILLTWAVPYIEECNYPLGQLVQASNGVIYRAKLIDNSYCPLDNSPLWLEVQPSNRAAMFDSQTSTACTANKELSLTLAGVNANTIGILNVKADMAIVTIRNGLGGVIIYQKTLNLIGGNVTNAWEYYFTDPLLRLTQGVFEDIPVLPTAHITITLSGTSTITLGNLILGQAKEMGLAEYGATAGILDFSVKTTNTFGDTTLVKRGFKKTLDLRTFVENTKLNNIQNTLYAVRATPCLWIGTSNPNLSEALVVYGFYKDFNTEISYPEHSYISIQIEGLF